MENDPPGGRHLRVGRGRGAGGGDWRALLRELSCRQGGRRRCAPSPQSLKAYGRYALDLNTAAKLWRKSEELVGEDVYSRRHPLSTATPAEQQCEGGDGANGAKFRRRSRLSGRRLSAFWEVTRSSACARATEPAPARATAAIVRRRLIFGSPLFAYSVNGNCGRMRMTPGTRESRASDVPPFFGYQRKSGRKVDTRR